MFVKGFIVKFGILLRPERRSPTIRPCAEVISWRSLYGRDGRVPIALSLHPFGETITCNWVITAIDQNGRAKASVTLTEKDGFAVIEAEISVLCRDLRIARS